AQFAVKLLRIGLTQEWPMCGQQVDVKRRPREVLCRQVLKPSLDLRFELHLTRRHSIVAILPSVSCSRFSRRGLTIQVARSARRERWSAWRVVSGMRYFGV